MFTKFTQTTFLVVIALILISQTYGSVDVSTILILSITIALIAGAGDHIMKNND